MALTRLDRLARFGYLARAAVYGLLGYLAITTSSLAHKGPEGDFELLRSVPGGRAVLLVLAAGLLAYGIYKVASAFLDTDSKGSEPKGLIERIGIAAGGAAYLAMCWASFQFAADLDRSASGGGGEQAAATTMQLPLGGLILAFAGICFIAAGAVQLRSAVTKSFMRTLQSDAPPLSCAAGRIGLGARAIVFAIIGWSLISAAWRSDKEEVRDLGGALAVLNANDLLYLAVALGLVTFAVYSAIEARYRIVPRVDAAEAGKRALS